MRQETILSTTGFEIDNRSGLKLTLLGEFTVTLDGRQLTDFDGRKAPALLFYLAVTGKPYSRDSLATLLWPEMAEKSAKNNLRTVLTSLKRQVGPYIDATPTTVAFAHQLPYALDVEAFRAGLHAALAAQDATALRAAIALYRGEFLQGFHVRNAAPFEEWMLQQREQLRLSTIQALETLTSWSLAHSDYAAGLVASRQLLALEPWHEQAHRQTMRLLVLTNQRTKSLSHFERAKVQLAEELGVEPSAETVALYEQIKAGEFAEKPTAVTLALADMSPAASDVEQNVPLPVAAPVVPHNLPAPLTSLIGREGELAYILDRLQVADSRLISVTGLGGIGKTHLVEEAARRMVASPQCAALFPDGVYWVPLVDVEPGNAADTDNAIALAVLNAIGVELTGNSTISQQLLAYLQHKQCLVVLDNFEHLMTSALYVTQLMQGAPGLTMLVTSREPLNVEGEWCLTVEGLALPQAGNEQWAETEAAALFLQQARQYDARLRLSTADAEQIVRICRLVAGLPLAIKLAAQWRRLWDCTRIADEIASSLDGLASRRRDTPARHRTMMAVFDSSWRMLTTDEQQVLMRLSIFRGSILETAARQVAQANLATLHRLVERSFVQVDADRHYSIHELLRQYLAVQRRRHNELDTDAQFAFCAFYAQWVKEQVPHLTEPNAQAVVKLVRLQRNNVQRAWSIAVEREDVAIIEQMWKETKELHDFYAYYQDGLALFEDAIARLHDVASPRLMGYLYMGKATYCERFGKSPRCV